ncbi:MAG: putative glycoside hydrolase, partial [Acidimicrobiales bacterium]
LDKPLLVAEYVGLPGAVVTVGQRSATTDRYGRARIDPGSVPVVVRVDHDPGGSATAIWHGTSRRLVFTLAPDVLRAVHVNGSLPGTARWQELLALADSTSINAIVLDIKDESGRVFPSTGSGWAALAGAGLDRWRLPEVVDELHDRGLSVITRIVAFQDPVAGAALPSMAAIDRRTGRAYTRRGQVFLDPTDAAARSYARELAVEACRAGVDEVQFDYVRFPDGVPGAVSFDGGGDETARVDAIEGFLADTRVELRSGCRLAADIFGFVASVAHDGGIGQQIERLAAVTDVLSPMVYPNHWGSGWFGFTTPADHPGPVVDRASRDAIERTAGTSTVIRPWLQDFGGYGAAQVRAQILAADRLGLGWMVWNAAAVYTPGGIPGEDELLTIASPPDPFEQDLPPSGFYDVPSGAGFEAEITWLAATGITRGCNPPWRDDFCPGRLLSRAEVAALLARALDLPPVVGGGGSGRFLDDDGSTHEADIERLAAAGITNGCGPRSFCPDDPVPRRQVAALLHRALRTRV